MIAYKCDRCGKYFDNKQGRVIRYMRFEKATGAQPNDYDLCYDCYDKFLEFIKNNQSGIFNDRGKEMLKKIGADKETVTEGYLGKV